jgi:transcriptional regulator with XRE-family HTH domain
MNEDMSVIDARADSLVESHAALLADLVDLRKKHNISQEVVAERMGVSQPTVSAFERYDSNPTLSTIRRYALAVGARMSVQIVDDCVDDDVTFAAMKRYQASASWSVPSEFSVDDAVYVPWSDSVKVNA